MGKITMDIVNLHTLAEVQQFSPKGKYGSFAKNISAALGAKHRVNPAGTPHPFDLQIRRLPPGKSVCPFHSHAAQWEMFTILQGRALVRRGGERHEVKAGDTFIHPPGTAHQITNVSETEDLVIQIIANNPEVDVCHYPDSGKMAWSPAGEVFRAQTVDYFEGEE